MPSDRLSLEGPVTRDEVLHSLDRQRRELQDLLSRVEELRQVTEQAIVNAHELGASMRSIAEAAGISHQRVHQIIQKGQS